MAPLMLLSCPISHGGPSALNQQASMWMPWEVKGLDRGWKQCVGSSPHIFRFLGKKCKVQLRIPLDAFLLCAGVGASK